MYIVIMMFLERFVLELLDGMQILEMNPNGKNLKIV